MMSVHIQMHNALGRIPKKLEKQILSGVKIGVESINQHIELNNIDITIVPHDYVHELTGVGGMTFGPESCSIYVNPNNLFLADHTHTNLPAIVVHELHHVLRMRTFDYTGSSVWCGGSVVVLEGLATQCETFLKYGKPVNVKDTELDNVIPLLKRLKPIADDKEANWYWIYELNNLPKYNYKAVYPMGYFLVGAYLETVSKNPIQALADSWEEIWNTGLRALNL